MIQDQTPKNITSLMVFLKNKRQIYKYHLILLERN